MNFHLSDDQLALQTGVADAVRQQDEARRAIFESDEGFDSAHWQEMMALGLGGVAIAEAHGGLGLGLVDLALVAEVIGHAATPGPFLGHWLAALAIQAGGGDAAGEWLPRLASGAAIGTVALGEANEAWAPESWTLSAMDGRLTGEKRNVLFAQQADVMVVGLADGQLGLVDLRAGDIEIVPVDGADRTRRVSHVRFNSAAVLPIAGDGAALFDAQCVLLAADAFGGARRCLEMTVDYVKERRQFGRAVGSFQAVKHRLAQLASEVEPARGLYWYAALAWDLNLPDRARVAALAKAHLGDRYNIAARTAVELHGGIGMTWDHDLQFWVKRAMFDFAYGGVPAQLRRRAMRDAEQTESMT